MANPPKPPPRPSAPPQASPRPPAAPIHANAPPAPKPPPAPPPEPPKPAAEAKPTKHEKVDVSALTLGFTVQTSISRLVAAHAEVKAWTHNLEQGLQADVEAGHLTPDEAAAVAEKYEVKAPKPPGHKDEAKETTPEMNEAAAAEGAKG